MQEKNVTNAFLEYKKKVVFPGTFNYFLFFMLNAIRRRQKILLTVFVSLISIVFVFWGFYGDFQSRGVGLSNIAKVNGESISLTEYQLHYERDIELYQNIFKDQFSKDLIERFNLKQLTLDRLIDQKILNQGAKQLGLAITDLQVRDEIVRTPAFQKEGKFNKEIYLLLLKHRRFTPAFYESQVRQELTQDALLSLFEKQVHVSDRELQDRYILEHDKINLEFIRMDPNAFKSKIFVTEGEIELELSKPKRLEEAQKYYNEQGNLFKQSEEVRARHILIKGTDETAKNKIKEVQSLVTPQNFSEMAKSHSQDSSAPQGGDLGYFSKGKMVKAFEEVAFSLQPGMISNIVETPFGFHLIKVEDRRAAKQKTFEEVKHSIMKTRLEEEKAKVFAEQVSSDVWNNKDQKSSLGSILKKHDLKWDETGLFARNVLTLPKIGKADEIKKVVFDLAPKTYAPRLFQLQNHTYLLKVKQRESADLKKFEAEKEKSKENMRRQKQMELYSEWLKELKEKSKIIVKKDIFQEF
ncbi:MAG: SurA N-terminal domain-containing protein [Deltaproteobacteria bacterium]|nr:SurA N-terminal domain-containing protein [Deltaproteobacteria bacterium]